MSEWIRTGNDFADYIYDLRFANDPFLWALIDYFESKGILNKVEFAQFVNARCQADVCAKEKAKRDGRASSD